jgi:hypothetical protein
MLIPIHEILHAIAYKICGAKKVSFDANLKQFYFMAMADQFVANRGEFIFVALAPFVTITLLGLLSLPFLSGAGMICMATCLLVHASCCAGDFSLLSFFEVQSGRDVITYDDRQKRESYFLFR